MAQKFFTRWHVAYCSVPTSRVKEVIRTGQLVHADWTGEVKLSPDIQSAQRIVSISPTKYAVNTIVHGSLILYSGNLPREKTFTDCKV